ncbi:MAG TPA: hypothetical protein VGB70_00970 [Allosphingosinicella sp.]|jgi:hypothetical protein
MIARAGLRLDAGGAAGKAAHARMFAGPEAIERAGSWIGLSVGLSGAAAPHWPRLWVPLMQSVPLQGCAIESPGLALVEKRLAELREIAEDEGTPYSFAAEADLVQFLDAAGAVNRPATYLMEDGSLRAKWVNLQGEQVAVQFVGGGRAQLVFFVDRGGKAMARIVGQDTVEGALCQVRSLGLLPLLCR